MPGTPQARKWVSFLLGPPASVDDGLFKTIARVFSKHPHTLHPASEHPDVRVYLLQVSLLGNKTSTWQILPGHLCSFPMYMVSCPLEKRASF